MKNLLLSPLLLLSSISLFSQNWMPVVSGDLYHFRAVDSSFVTHTIRVDSVEVSGTDSIFYLNRVIHVENLTWDTIAVANNWGQFLGQRLVKKQDGRVQLQSDEGDTPFTIMLEPNAGLNTVWQAIAELNVSATVVSIGTGMVLGEADSLKTIQFSNGATWVLSKNHGIVEADALFSNEQVHLSGIESRQLGEKPLRFNDFFDFPVGSIFEWYIAKWSLSFGSEKSIEKWKILDKQIYPDSFRYLIERRRKVTYDLPFVFTGYPPVTTEWVSYMKEHYPFTESYNKENVVVESEFPILPGPMGSTYVTLFEGGKKIGTRPTAAGAQLECTLFPLQNDFSQQYYYRFGDCCSSPTNCDKRYFYEEFRAGLGRVLRNLAYISDRSIYEELTGAVIQGDTVWGQISPDLIFTATQSPQNGGPLTITPNPAGDFIQFSALEMEGDVRVTVSDLSGKMMLNTKLNANNMPQLNISRLSPGIYFVQLLHENRVWTGKFQKVD